jgi:hypothetical protein
MIEIKMNFNSSSLFLARKSFVRLWWMNFIKDTIVI